MNATLEKYTVLLFFYPFIVVKEIGYGLAAGPISVAIRTLTTCDSLPCLPVGRDISRTAAGERTAASINRRRS